jgi:tetratricopeptide (TPR) repeat protein
MTLTSVALMVGLAAAPNAHLLAAEGAYEQGVYQEVLPAVERALKDRLTLPEQRRAYELRGVALAAFDRRDEAIDSFRRVLELDPNYLPSPFLSPKVRAVIDEARRRTLGSEESRLLSPPGAQAEPAPPLHTRWWFWTAVGVAAAGAGVGAYVFTRPNLPRTNLGTGTLK